MALMTPLKLVKLLTTKQFIVINLICYLAILIIRILYVRLWFKTGVELAEITFDPRGSTFCVLQGAAITIIAITYSIGFVSPSLRRLSFKSLSLIGTLFATFALLAPPSNSIDVFVYIGFGRLAGVYHLNPYLSGYSVGDWYGAYAWFKYPMAYGPLMLPAFRVAGLLSNLNVLMAAYFLKVVFFLAYLVCLRILKTVLIEGRDEASARFYLFALNPLIILEFISDAHTESVLAVFCLMTILAIRRNRPFLAICSALLAAMVKIPPGALVFAVILVWLWRKKQWRDLFCGLMVTAGLGLLLHHFLFPNIASARSLFLLLDLPNPNSLYSIPMDLVHSFGSHVLKLAQSQSLALMIAAGKAMRLVSLLSLFAISCWRVCKVRDNESAVSESGVLIICLVVLGGYWSCPWYVLWALPFAVVSRFGLLQRIAVSFTLSMLVLYIVPASLFQGSFLLRALRLALAHLSPYVWLLPKFDLKISGWVARLMDVDGTTACQLVSAKALSK